MSSHLRGGYLLSLREGEEIQLLCDSDVVHESEGLRDSRFLSVSEMFLSGSIIGHVVRAQSEGSVQLPIPAFAVVDIHNDDAATWRVARRHVLFKSPKVRCRIRLGEAPDAYFMRFIRIESEGSGRIGVFSDHSCGMFRREPGTPPTLVDPDSLIAYQSTLELRIGVSQRRLHRALLAPECLALRGEGKFVLATAAQLTPKRRRASSSWFRRLADKNLPIIPV
jgi:uncharacterized protein (AIM24 family)